MISLASFRHGVHPPDEKELTAKLAARRMPFPKEVVLPLSQHLGTPAKAIVRVGDRVERGDLIAEPMGAVSAPVHSSVSGVVHEIGLWPHPSGAVAPAIRIEVSPYSPQVPRPRLVPDWQTLETKEIAEAIRRAGIVGLGGAAFPAAVKMSPPKEHAIDVLLVNGCECEPYLTADHRVMLEQPERVFFGIRILLKALGIQRAQIGVEANKPDAIEALRAACPKDLDVIVQALTVKYPQGAEKMLIKALTNREVPSGKLPSSIGVLVQNVTTVSMIGEVFETGLPLIERIITVSGRGVRRPGNWIVPLGTKIRDVLEICGGLRPEVQEILLGGPMMGIAQSNLDAPILKGTGGVLALTGAECKAKDTYPCIRCGRCLDACPVFLNPQMLGNLAKAERYDEMLEYHLNDCMLCGCCSYVCPSNIPLSQLFLVAKTYLRKNPPEKS